MLETKGHDDLAEVKTAIQNAPHTTTLIRAGASAIELLHTALGDVPCEMLEEKPVSSPFEVEVPAVTSNEQTIVAEQTVSPDFFDLMSQELAAIIGRLPYQLQGP